MHLAALSILILHSRTSWFRSRRTRIKQKSCIAARKTAVNYARLEEFKIFILLVQSKAWLRSAHYWICQLGLQDWRFDAG